MVPALTEGDVRSGFQKHTANTLFTSKEQGSYTLNESNVTIVLLNLWKD